METTHLFTCLSCAIAFNTPDEQREHYRSDHHKYNMKRRVASLPPISLAMFSQKVVERKAETAVMPSPKGKSCAVCSKFYTTENAYRSHINSKKHKDNEIQAVARPKVPTRPAVADLTVVAKRTTDQVAKPTSAAASGLATIHGDGDVGSEEELSDTIDQKIAAARSRLSPCDCLFCPHTSAEFADNLTHMSAAHSFFVPDADYLVDITGLISYLGEKIAVGNFCLYCNEKSKDFRDLHAVRKHMIDKSHCKIAYNTEKDRLEISDYYDFSSSYPDADANKRSNDEDPSDDGWEDMEDGDAPVDEVIDAKEDSEDDSDAESEADSLPDADPIAYDDTRLELVLPSGTRVGHRSTRLTQPRTLQATRRLRPADGPATPSGVALVRRLLADKNSALVPRRGGFGAFGRGTEVVKARNPGEAREAQRPMREFRERRRLEDFKTKVGLIGNHQKHYRDPLLQ